MIIMKGRAERFTSSGKTKQTKKHLTHHGLNASLLCLPGLIAADGLGGFLLVAT